MVSGPFPGNRAACKAWEEPGAKAAVGNTTTSADGGYPGTGTVMPHRRDLALRMDEAAHTAPRLVRVDSRITAGRASRCTVRCGFDQMA